eukprot:TRINITY_DN977_c0_g1_i10.p1 TRINITY_DN977_c0_g1~~TRINITY_DN977_c0_g1_i10.p1  ORF type:complete len:219 (-),score=10.53 TRINITY_DN977_c0_g1_i10:97-705(-)
MGTMGGHVAFGGVHPCWVAPASSAAMTRRLKAVQALLAAAFHVHRRPGQRVARTTAAAAPALPPATMWTARFCAAPCILAVQRRSSVDRSRAGWPRSLPSMPPPCGRWQWATTGWAGGFGGRWRLDAAAVCRLPTFWDVGMWPLVHARTSVAGESRAAAIGRLCTCTPASTGRPPHCTYKMWPAVVVCSCSARCVTCAGGGG